MMLLTVSGDCSGFGEKKLFSLSFSLLRTGNAGSAREVEFCFVNFFLIFFPL